MTLLSQPMPGHLISDMHEWINKFPTVPIYYLVKPQARKCVWQDDNDTSVKL